MKKHPKKKKNKTVVFGLSGSIACHKVCDSISELAAEGVEVHCILTEAARQFITPLTLASLSGRPVFENSFTPSPFPGPLHTHLARQADLIVIAPATADVIARLAHGMADDLVTSVVLASTAPKVFAPAMNEQMWLNRFTQENAGRLLDAGFRMIEPVRGHLVCQMEGMGHIAPAEAITRTVRAMLKGK